MRGDCIRDRKRESGDTDLCRAVQEDCQMSLGRPGASKFALPTLPWSVNGKMGRHFSQVQILPKNMEHFDKFPLVSFILVVAN